MANYSLEITRPDGSSEHFKLLASDDEWGRPLKFRVEGFSNDGSHALILLVEGNYPQSLQANDFDINSGHTVKSVLLDSPFSSRLSRDCAATLHIIGTSPEGYIVLGTEAKDGCTRVERWQLSHNKTFTEMLPGMVRLRSPTITLRIFHLTPRLPALSRVFPSSRDDRRCSIALQ